MAKGLKIQGWLADGGKVYKTKAAVKAQNTIKEKKALAEKEQRDKVLALREKSEKLRQSIEDEIRELDDNTVAKHQRRKKKTNGSTPIEQMDTATLINKINNIQNILNS